MAMGNNKAANPRYSGGNRRVSGAYLAIAHGWNDFVSGKPFRAEYESAGEHWQRHYELGRSEAAAASSIASVPTIRLNRTFNNELKRLAPGQWPLAETEMNFHASNANARR